VTGSEIVTRPEQDFDSGIMVRYLRDGSGGVLTMMPAEGRKPWKVVGGTCRWCNAECVDIEGHNRSMNGYYTNLYVKDVEFVVELL
jgi:hypothetical protein